jgi:hypothetical protein
MKKTTLEKFSVSAIAEQIGAVGVGVRARFGSGRIRESSKGGETRRTL